MEIVKKYAPYIYFDENEPFLPVMIGCTIFYDNMKSPSSTKNVTFYCKEIKFVIEYAIYWDYDIQHLYDLEHIWVYVDYNGDVFNCEGSFHGLCYNMLLKDRSNIEDSTHVRVFSQPGKHAFSPVPEFFDLIPEPNSVKSITWQYAGKDGLLYKCDFIKDSDTKKLIDCKVESYMQKFKFIPSMRFAKYDYPEGIFEVWDTLCINIPVRLKERLVEIGCGELLV